ncbi:MAG: DsbA family protein, partial [Acinetobacter sp.]
SVAQGLGLDVAQVQTWLADEQVKAQLKSVTDEAIERGVFGAPTWFVGDEMFWGVDHLHFVEMELSKSDN